MQTQTLQKIADGYYTHRSKCVKGGTEQHNIVTLAARVLLSRSTVYKLLQSSALRPIGKHWAGDKPYVFLSYHLDELRKSAVDSVVTETKRKIARLGGDERQVCFAALEALKAQTELSRPTKSAVQLALSPAIADDDAEGVIAHLKKGAAQGAGFAGAALTAQKLMDYFDSLHPDHAAEIMKHLKAAGSHAASAIRKGR